MEKITRITSGDTTYALFIHGRPATDSIKFFTEPTDDMQLGVMERPTGYEVKAHQHPPYDRHLTTTSECLFIEKGKVRITVFDEEWKELAVETMQTGDFLIFFRGGHGLTMLEPTRMIEIKQGPYAGEEGSKAFKA